MPDNNDVISVGITADAGSLSSAMAKMTVDVKASLASLEAAFKQANLELKLAPRMDPKGADGLKQQAADLQYQVDFTKAMLGRLTLEWQRAAERVKAAQAAMASGTGTGGSQDLQAALASQQAIAERMARLQQMSATAAAAPGQTAGVEAGQTAQQAAIQKTAQVQAESSTAQVEAVEAQTTAEIEATEAAAAVRQASEAASTEAYLARATAQAAANRARVTQAVEGEEAQAGAAIKTTGATEATTAAARQNGAATVQAMTAGSGSASLLALRLSLLTEQHAQAARAVRSYAQESLQAAETAAALGRTGSEAAAQITANLEAAIVKERELAAAVEQATIELEKMDGVVQHVAGSMLNAQLAGQVMRETIGVGIPRAMERVMSMSPLMGAALQLAMPVFIAVMIAEAIEKIAEKVLEWRDGLAQVKEFNEQLGGQIDKQIELQQRLAKENREANFKLIGAQHGPAAEERAREAAQTKEHAQQVNDLTTATNNLTAATKRYHDAQKLVAQAAAEEAAARAAHAADPDGLTRRPPRTVDPQALAKAQAGLGIDPNPLKKAIGGRDASTEGDNDQTNPLRAAMDAAIVDKANAEAAAALSGKQGETDRLKAAKDNAREIVATLKAADQEALADKKDDHELSVAEEIAFWETRAHIQAGYVERDREIRHTIAQLHQAQFKEQAGERTRSADATAEGMIRSDESPDYSAREKYWAQLKLIDEAGLKDRTRTQGELDHATREEAAAAANFLKQTDEDRVKADKDALQRLHDAHLMSAEQDAEYWAEIAFFARTGSKEEIAALDAMRAALAKVPEENYKRDQGAIQGAFDRKAGALQTQEQQGRDRAALGGGGFTADRQELQQRQAIDQQLIQLELQKDARMRALAIAAGKDTTDIDNKAVQDYQKGLLIMEKDQLALDLQLKKSWDKLFTGINAGFTSTINSMMKHQETFAQGMVKLWNDMVSGMVQALLKVVLRWAENELVITVLHLTGVETRLGADLAAQMKQQLLLAKSAAGGAYNSVVGIPYVGPVLAPIAAAVAFAAVMAFEQGGIVPGGSGATAALLHPNEMVLPAPLSQGFQRMLGAGGGGSAGNTHLHYSPTVHAYGAGGLEDMLKSHASTIHQIVKRGQRTGHLT